MIETHTELQQFRFSFHGDGHAAPQNVAGGADGGGARRELSAHPDRDITLARESSSRTPNKSYIVKNNYLRNPNEFLDRTLIHKQPGSESYVLAGPARPRDAGSRGSR
ncbi:hypothetical protein EVAR_80848_1 [Eumeta japonica]|uniref:Uncharacterized protein n=1 Tax=Eumeta variegata TaxID=151549 RepID=A0A4C1V1D8_EUMVA|nr:hypothetical protein EVAR_80848_1 [Eumeta japonica]